jgi:hypothetical protein
MKNRLFYAFITIAVLIAASCSRDNPEELLRPGYLVASINSPSYDSTSKTVPLCGGVPVYAVYSLLNEYGIYRDTFDIVFDNKKAMFKGQMTFGEGEYTVEDVSLYDVNWNVTHLSLDGTESYNLSFLVSKTVPYPITIIAYDTVTVRDEVVCFNYIEPEEPQDNGEITIVAAESIHFYVPVNTCLTRIVLFVDGEEIISTEDMNPGLHTFAIPIEFESFSLEGYIENALIQSFSGNDHSAENIYYFALNCE